MRLNTLSRYPHSAALSSVHYTTDPNTGLSLKSWIVTGTAVASKFITPSSGYLHMYSKAQLKTFDRLMSPTDAAGVAMFDEVSTVGFEITTVSPIMNPLGFIDGYAYGIKRLVRENV